MIILAILGLVVPCLLGYGISLFFFQKRELDFFAKIIISSSLGFGLLGYLVFVMNQFLGVKLSFLTTIIMLSAFFLMAITFIIINYQKQNASIFGLFNEFKGKLNAMKIKENLFLKLLIAFIFIFIFYKALFFPIVDGDALGMHGPMIEHIYKTGYLSNDVGPSTMEFTRAFPAFFKIIGSWLVILNQDFNDIFIRLLPALFSVLLSIATYALAMRILKDKRKSLLALLLSLSFPALALHGVFVNEDMMFSFFAVAAAYLLIAYLQTRKPAYMVFGIISLAFTTQVKHLGMPFCVSVLMPLFLILHYKKIIACFKEKGGKAQRNLKKKQCWIGLLKSNETKAFFIGILILIAIIAPYFIRNIIVFKDPVYPYLSYAPPYIESKNFVPFLFEPIKLHMESAKLPYALHHPGYFLFGLANYVLCKGYSMSVLFLFLLAFALWNFKSLRQEQKYLLYFIIFFTAYYVWSFLLKYRYYLAAVPLLCIVVADQLNAFISFRLTKKQKKFILFSALIVLVGILLYLLMVYNHGKIADLLGPQASHFIHQADFTLMLNLVVPLLALILILALRNPKLRAVVVVLILMLPSLFGLFFIRTGLLINSSGETFGFIDPTQDISLFTREVLKPIPSKEAVLKLYFRDYYPVVQFINNNLQPESRIMSFGEGSIYYVNNEMVPFDSYKMQKTFDTSLSLALDILKEQGITHVLYRSPSWEETVFGKDSLSQKSAIIQNLNDTQPFKKVYENKEFAIYQVIYD